MFKFIFKKVSGATFFEKLLLGVGFFIGVFGFWVINKIFVNDPNLNWQLLTAVFLWLLLIFVIILTDSNESIKEELSTIIKEHILETKLLKKEVVLLRQVLTKKK